MSQIGWKYDLCFAPKEEEAGYLEECLKKAQAFFNKLVAIRKASNKAIEDWRIGHSEKYRALSEQVAKFQGDLSAVFDEVRKARAKVRARVEPSKEQQERIEALRADIKTASKALTSARADFKGNDDYKAFLAATNEDEATKKKEARHNSGLHWGIYNGVVDALKGEPFPKYKIYEGVSAGRLVMQFQSGVGKLQPTWADLLAGRCNTCRPAITYQHKKKGDLVEITLKWGPKQPAVTVTLWMHRPLPADAVVTNLYLIKRKVGYSSQWSLSFVLKREAGFAKEDCAPRGVVAVDWNYRQVEGGLRVATWLDEEGNHGHLILPQRLVDRDRKCRELQSLCDQKFDEVLPKLVEALPAEAPDWFSEATRTLPQWEAQSRLWRLWQRWKDNRFGGDEVAFALLATWQEREQHLAEWEANQRKRVQRQRREIYRVWVSEMRRRYHTFVLEGGSIAETRRTPPPDQKDNPALKINRNVASPGELMGWIKQTVAEVIEKDPAYTSQDCHLCGERTAWAGQLLYTCEHCGSQWDCDINACHNLLASGKVVS